VMARQTYCQLDKTETDARTEADRCTDKQTQVVTRKLLKEL